MYIGISNCLEIILKLFIFLHTYYSDSSSNNSSAATDHHSSIINGNNSRVNSPNSDSSAASLTSPEGSLVDVLVSCFY